MNPIGQCKLCLQMKELQDSHLMPKSLYKKSRIDGAANPNPMVISARGSKQTSKQITDYVLCRDCEQLFNKNGESYAMKLVTDDTGKFPLMDEIDASRPTKRDNKFRYYDLAALPKINREIMGYFAVSVIWRASVHEWAIPEDTSPQIRLGPYQERMRTYLLGLTPFPANVLLMFIVCTDSESQRTFHVPGTSRKDGIITHGFLARGIAFLMIVGKDVDGYLEGMCCVKGKDKWILAGSYQDKLLTAGRHIAYEASLRVPL